jgi:hypothetical protein
MAGARERDRLAATKDNSRQESGKFRKSSPGTGNLGVISRQPGEQMRTRIGSRNAGKCPSWSRGSHGNHSRALKSPRPDLPETGIDCWVKA